MKKLLLAGILLFSVMLFAGSPHPVYLIVTNGDVVEPLTFTADIVETVGDVTDQTATGSDWNASIPGGITVQCGSFASQWNAGETLHVVAIDGEGKTGFYDLVLTTDGYQYVPGAITLEGGAPSGVFFSAFTAEFDGEFVTVNLTVASESNMSHYNLIRSDVLISTQDAANITSEHVYTFTDVEVEVGTYEYWVEAVHSDGEITETVVLSIEITENPVPETTLWSFDCVNNNATANPTIMFNIGNEAAANITIYNVKGEVVKTADLSGNYEVTDLSSGVYLFKLSSEMMTGKNLGKFVIVK